MKQIITLLSKTLITRCTEQMNIELTISSALKEHIVDKYSEPKMGARPLKRAVQSVIEDKLAEEVLSGKIKAGDKVTVGIKNGEVVFKVKE